MGISDRLTGEINFIVSYFWNGCRTPGQLWVETALPVAGRIALVFLTSDWSDIVTKFFRPSGLRQNRHGRKRRRGKFAMAGTSPHDLIAIDFEVVREAMFGTPTAGTKFLWNALDVIEGVTWNVAVITMSKDLVFESILGVLQLRATKCDVPGRVFVTGEEYHPFNNGQSYFVPPTKINYVEYPCKVQNGIVACEDEGPYQILADITAYNKGDIPGEFLFDFVINGGPDAGTISTPWTGLDPGSTESLPISFVAHGPFSCRWQQRSRQAIVFPEMNISLTPSFFSS